MLEPEFKPEKLFQPVVSPAVSDAIAKFRDEFRQRSFSQRHPELGKMIKCQICLLRHRSIKVCQQNFAVGTHDPAPDGEKKLLVAAQTLKGIFGAARFAKKRIHPHPSKKKLQLVELTQKLFPKYYIVQIAEPEKAMQAARGEARQILKRKHQTDRRKNG